MKLSKRDQVIIEIRTSSLSEYIGSYEKLEINNSQVALAKEWLDLLTRILNESDKEE